MAENAKGKVYQEGMSHEEFFFRIFFPRDIFLGVFCVPEPHPVNQTRKAGGQPSTGKERQVLRVEASHSHPFSRVSPY